MGKKRAAPSNEAQVPTKSPVEDTRAPKKARKGDTGPSLKFLARPDWHAADLPAITVAKNVKQQPQDVVTRLHEHADSLLEADNKTYAATNASSSSFKFMSSIMSSGTLEDKISALTLLVQESPVHNMKAFENLLNLAKKKSRNQALMAVAALKDLLGQGSVLPDRKLRAFGKQPGLLSALSSTGSFWRSGTALPGGLKESHLIAWAFEDWLKKSYFELLKILESWCSDEVEYARSRSITYVWEMLRDKPEQEENLLRLLVNKLGDTERKIASRTSHLLLQLQLSHPAMKPIIIDAIESESLFKSGQSSHAKYYSIITLNQTIIGKAESNIANKLLEIYFSLFIQLLKPASNEKLQNGAKGPLKVQGGGGKPGKKAAKKAKALEGLHAAEDELRQKMVAQVLTGINRAFPFANTDDPTFEEQMNTLFRVTHSSNFNTSIQALMLIQKVSSAKHYSADRFYRTLYESLLDPRLLTSSKHVLYLNLLYRSLVSDINAKRVQAFVKRLLQIITLHEAPFVCGVLFLISELIPKFPNLRNLLNEPETKAEDEEEHFHDVADNVATVNGISNGKPSETYDARKRDPEHSNADRSALWDILPFLAHFHPSVSVFAEAILHQKAMPPKPDPSHHTLMHFLDRFVYRNAKTKAAVTRGSSIMQPIQGSNAADLLIKPSTDARTAVPLNSEAFWRKSLDNIPADEVFFHNYFNEANRGKPASKKKQQAAKKDAEESDDEEEIEGGMDEDEVWKALVDSKPDIDGPDEDDDISLGDLESAYSGSDVEIPDMGDAGVEIADFPEDEGEDLGSEGEADDDMVDLESGDDAMLDDDDDVPSDFEGLDDGDSKTEQTAEKKKADQKKKEKKKLKNLPTFASADDYAKMLADEPDELY